MVKFFRIISLILLFCWMVFIFLLSSQNASDSSNTSAGFISSFMRLFYPDFETLTLVKQLEFVGSLQFFVRKAAHFTIYGILGGFSFFSFITYKGLKPYLRLLISLSVCLVYSITDEIHQLFVVGRSGEIRDVCIDFCGSLLAVAILYFMVKFSRFNGVLKYEKKRTIKT